MRIISTPISPKRRPIPRPAAIYRFDGDDALKGREVFYYNEEGYCTGREFYEKGELNRTIQQEEDPDRGVVIEREDGRIRENSMTGGAICSRSISTAAKKRI